MKEEFDQRFSELLTEGNELTNSIPKFEGDISYWIPDEKIAEYQKWISSVVNLIRIVDQPNGIFIDETKKLLNNKDLENGIPSGVVQKAYGLLSSAKDEWDRGFLRKIEHIVIAEAFDDFLDHASFYHRGNKKIESSVLASTVLEDTIKRIARKNNIETKGESLEPLIDKLELSTILCKFFF